MVIHLILTKQNILVKQCDSEEEAMQYIKDRPYLKYEQMIIT